MKKVFYYLFLVLCAVSVQTAQAQSFSPTLKVTGSRSLTDPGIINGIVFDGNIELNDYFSVGPTIGFEMSKFQDDRFRNHDNLRFQKELILPLSVNAKYYFQPSKKVSPFIYGQTGYTFCLCKDFSLWKEDKYVKDIIDEFGLDAAVGAGIDIALKHGSLQLSLDWNLQKIKECGPNDNDFTSESLIGISVGYKWGNRKYNKTK